MKVFLIRHAHATGEAPGIEDAFRSLSENGRRTARAVGHKLASEGVRFDAVLTSPLVRAVQTAELLAQATDYLDVIEALPALRPDVPPRLVAEQLTSRGVSVAVVGHAPGISALGALLVERPSFPPLRPAQVCLIEDGLPIFTISPDTLAMDRLLMA